MNVSDLFDIISKGGVLALTMGLMIAFMRGWIRTGHDYRQISEQHRLSEQQLDHALHVARSQLHVMEWHAAQAQAPKADVQIVPLSEQQIEEWSRPREVHVIDDDDNDTAQAAD